MRSRQIPDSLLGGIVALVLVAAAAFVLWATDRHAEEHGHHAAGCPAVAIGAHQPEARRGREVNDLGHGLKPACASGVPA